MRVIRVFLVGAAAGLLLTGCVAPGSAPVTASPGPSRSASPTPTPTPTAAPTPTTTPEPTAEPTAPPLPPAEGEDPQPSGDWTAESVYQACLDAPDADPANPIVSYGSQAESRIDQSGPGYWQVVIPVSRSAGAGQQVCFIDGTPGSPSVSVAPAL